MNLLENFCGKIGLSAYDCDDVEYEIDQSGYNFVDGEEGDFGTLKYYDANGIIAVKTIYGGDEEEVEFTSYGMSLLTPKAVLLFQKRVDALQKETFELGNT